MSRQQQKPRLVERLTADLERGDLGTARGRLASAVGAGTYDQALLRRVAELSLQMRDPVEAGRYWFLTDAQGPEVEQAIDAFLDACRHDPRLLVARLPHFKRRFALEAYSAGVAQRLARHGIDSLFREQAIRQAPIGPLGLKEKAKGLGCLLLIGALGTGLVLALRQASRWWCS